MTTLGMLYKEKSKPIFSDYWNFGVACKYSITQSMPALHKCQELFSILVGSGILLPEKNNQTDVKFKEPFEAYGNNM